VISIKPDGGGEVFRATFTELFEGDTERRPNVGDVAKVEFHQRNNEVKFDRDALESEKKVVEDADRSSFDALAAAPPSTVAAGPPDIASVSAAFDEALAKAKAKMEEYEAAKQAGDPTAAAHALAEGKGFNEEQIRLGAELRRLRGLGS
jgi:hypothetical protein